MGDRVRDELVRAVAAGDVVRILAVDVTSAAEEARVRHGLGTGAARVGADAVVAAALMSAHIKGDERMTLQLQGSEPRLAVFAEIDAFGAIRARITPADAEPGPDGEVSGVLVAVKADAREEMYRGATEVRGGNLEAALAEHLGASAQIDVVLRIRTAFAGDGTVTEARGVLVEKLPGHLKDPQEAIRALSVLEVLKDRTTDEIAEALDAGQLLGEPIDVLERRPLVWRCRCSRSRVEDTLVGLGRAELLEMIEQDGGAEVTCHFCNEAYRFTADELRALAGPELPEA